MPNRRSIMAFSGLQILLYHLWINMFPGNQVEMFLRASAFVGVDIFFFLSGFSLGCRETGNYWTFIKSRFTSVYLKFILFAIAALIYSKWKFTRLFEVIFAVEFFKKGGGSFLWFLPAIMICYLLFPLYRKADNKKPRLTLTIAILVWTVTGVLITYLTSYKVIFIFWMRLPVFLLGFYAAKNRLLDKCLDKNVVRIVAGIALIIIGGVLFYLTGFKTRLSVPMVDMFYVFGIPSAIGLIMLVSYIPEVKLIEWIGKSTLEMYGVQMVFGYKMANFIFTQTQSKMLTNIASTILVIIIAVLLQFAYNYIRRQLNRCIAKQ
ncbi:MAG: acyltransferase [Saccharofermentans sp.]|nr:acyltransferase [Saccharofermentans sp.]